MSICRVLLLLIAMVLSAYSVSDAASGRTFVPGIAAYYQSDTMDRFTFIKISNTSVSTVSVKMTVVKQDGTVIRDDGSSTTGYIWSVYPGRGYTDNVSDGTVVFDMAPHSTTRIDINSHPLPNTHLLAYGIIEWTCAGIDPGLPLMAHGEVVSYNGTLGSASAGITINNGLPF